MDAPKPRLDDLRIDRSREPKPKRWLGLVVVLLLLGLLAAGLVWVLPSSRPIAVPTVEAREVLSERGGPGVTVLNASGYVTARREATVSSKVTGKVVEVLIEEGMKVSEGQVLARLDDTNVKASLQLAQARLLASSNALAETKVRIREAQQELRRQSDLLTNRIATTADFERAEAAALAYEARLQQQQAEAFVAQKEVASWELQLDDTIIRAPFSGIVTSKNAQPGEMISPISAGGGFTRTGICTIVDMDSLEVEIDVNESYINRVEPGQQVEASLDAYPDWKIPCHVIAIIPTADRQKSTVKVRVGFEKLDRRILPQMSIKVAFRGATGSAGPISRTVLISKDAVQNLDGKDVVFVIKDGKAERRAVTVAGSSGTDAVISAGLDKGERVASQWPKGLADGAQVKAVSASK